MAEKDPENNFWEAVASKIITTLPIIMAEECFSPCLKIYGMENKLILTT